MCGIADNNIERNLCESMKHWKTELRSGTMKFATVNIKGCIFQGDSLSPLLFVMVLIPLTRVLRKEKEGFFFGNSKKRKINHLLFMDDLKIYGSHEREAER